MLLATVLSSCHDEHLTAAQCAALASDKAVANRCKGMIDDAKCFPFSSPKRMRGIQLGGFEQSKFFPDATRATATMWNDYSIWIRSSTNFTSDVPQIDHKNGGAFLIEFVGRRSLCPYGYGHLNAYKNEILIDHLISSKRVTLPDLWTGDVPSQATINVAASAAPTPAP